MLQYVARKRTLFKEITRAACELPSQALGYIMQRDAGLSDKAWDTLETWNKGSYELTAVATSLRKLERPIPGKGTMMAITGMTGYVGEDMESQGDPSLQAGGVTQNFMTAAYGAGQCSECVSTIFMTESLFVLPETFSDDQITCNL